MANGCDPGSPETEKEEDRPEAEKYFDDKQATVLSIKWKKKAIGKAGLISMDGERKNYSTMPEQEGGTEIHVYVGVSASVYNTKSLSCRSGFSYDWCIARL